MARALKGRQKTNTGKRLTFAPARQKVHTYLLFVLIFVFSKFLGASRQGEFENTRKQIEFVSGKFFFTIFSFEFLLLRWLSASR
jgi:hypothetical protein